MLRLSRRKIVKSVKYLQRMQDEKNLNAAGAARVLNLTEAAISHYKSGRRVMDDETCIAIALQLGIHPMEVIGAACIDRAEKTGQKSLWEVFMSRTAMTAGAVLVASGVNLFLTTPPANAATMRAPATTDSSFYRLCEIRRRRDSSRKSAVRAWFKRMLMPATLKPTAS